MGTSSQTDDVGRRASSEAEIAATATDLTRRQRLLDKEHQVVDQERELLHEEVRELHELEQRVAKKLQASTPGRIWTRLGAVEFMNSSMQFAALALLCLFPFLIIVASALGGDARPALIRRLGLDEHAAKDVNTLMSSGTHATAGLDVLGAALVLLGAIGVASTLQAWYQKVYAQQVQHKWTRQLVAQLLWLVGLVTYLFLQDLSNRQTTDVGARVPIYAVFFAIAIGFYWWTQHVLLLGKVRWRPLLPGAIATGICVTGLAVFSSLIFSGQIVSSDKDYGSIGVVMVLLSYLIGFGVCLHIGAVAGQVWNERQAPAAPPQEEEPAPT